MNIGELFQAPEFKRFFFFCTFVAVGAASPIVYKIKTEIENTPGKSFFLYRRKCLEANLDDNENPLDPNQCLDQKKQSTLSIMMKNLNFDYSKMILPALTGCAVGFSLYKFYFLRRVKSSKHGKVLVIYRKQEGPKQGDNDIIRTLYTIPDNQPFPVGRFIYPWQEVGYITEEPIDLKFDKFKVFSKDGVEIQITLDLVVGVSEKDVTLSLYRASAYLLDLTADEIKERATECLMNGLKDNIKDFKYSEISGHIVDFNFYLTQIITWYLKYLGLVVRKAPMVHITTPDGEIDIPLINLK